MLSNIKNSYHKAKAATILEISLENQGSSSFYGGDSVSLSTNLVADAWNRFPHLCDGRYGQRPNELSIAAAALACGIQNRLTKKNNRYLYGTCLGLILREIDTKGHLYPLNGLDDELVHFSYSVFAAATNALITGPKWENWISDYKDEAGKHSHQLTSDENGKSIFDFLDLSSARQAYESGLDPRIAGKSFAKQCDMFMIGRPPHTR